MSNRFLNAVSALAVVPTLALAQQPAARPPAQTPPAQQPAARPATPATQAARPMGTAERKGAFEITIEPTAFIARDEALFNYLYNRVSTPADAPDRYLPGAFGRLAYHVSPALSINAGLGYGFTSGLTLMQPFGGIQYTFKPDSKSSFFFTAAAVASMWSGDGPASEATGVGGHGGLGWRRFIGEKVALRLEGRAGFNSYSNEDISAIEGSAGIGLSWFMGGGPPRDTDVDGVPDNRDRCANTARGAVVDANGCPRDSDRDGVFDGLDRCANTPANTPVDANGCPRDTDRDGIADNADRCPNTTAGTPVDANGCPRDADGDGVADNADRCANTPRGTPVDAAGCPRDADSDGVADNMDRCPNTPAGTQVDANGCPRDADGDGVTDAADRCPNTPAGTQVGPDGCPTMRDADRDNVADERDRCPNTPAGRMVDANGCPLAELPAVGATLVIRNINFASGTTRLTPASVRALGEIATSMQAVLRTSPNARFEVGGHTDNRGAIATNRRLSQSRAQAVVTALTRAGVPARALTAVGYGPDNPVGPNTTTAGRAQNRRVEVKRLS